MAQNSNTLKLDLIKSDELAVKHVIGPADARMAVLK